MRARAAAPRRTRCCPARCLIAACQAQQLPAARALWPPAAACVFCVGCGASVLHGVSSLMNPHPLENMSLSLAGVVVQFAIVGGHGWEGGDLPGAAPLRPPLLPSLCCLRPPGDAWRSLRPAPSCTPDSALPALPPQC